MRRAELIAVLMLGGCMRIYPDPELPDVEVEWGDQDCRGTTGSVALTLTGVDSPSTATITVPCTDLTATFADVARERFHVAGSLLGLDGTVFSMNESDVDLRNGFNETVGLYFDGFSNFRAAWTFDGGATCTSLGATSVGIFLSLPGEPDVDAYELPCTLGRFSGSVPTNTYTAQLRAFSGETIVAVSQDTASFDVTFDGLTDLGVVTLVACGASCP